MVSKVDLPTPLSPSVYHVILYHMVDLVYIGESSSASEKGVNQFWLVALKNCEIFADLIKVDHSDHYHYLIHFSYATHTHLWSGTR